MKDTLHKAIWNFIDLVLPPRCVVSGETVDVQGMLSPAVWQGLAFIHDPLCRKCGIPFEFEVDDDALCAECLTTPPVYKQARAAVRYNDTSRDLILRFKRADQTLAVHCFTPWLKSAGAKMLEKSDIIVPVPLHPMRLIRRRYNQAAILAQNLSAVSHVGTCLGGLKRSRSTVSQGKMNAADRFKNVKDAFIVPDQYKSVIGGLSVLLIDDVYTSGSTVKECCKALLDAGAREVYVLTVARVIKD